jgi:hypothetical protein
MLSQNGHLHRTDGNNSFDIWSWDGQTNGVSLRSYDGRLFVGTYEWTDTADVGMGVLYQFTGAAVTELKRWGRVGKATSIGNMIVYNRKLYYGASSLFGVRGGFGVAVYDSIEDGHSIYAIQDDTTTYPDTPVAGNNGSSWLVDDLIVFGGHLFCAVRGYGVFQTTDHFKDVELGTSRHSTSTIGGELISSLYDAGTPGMKKLWRKINIYIDLPLNTSFTLSYSLNGGTLWTPVATKNGIGGLTGAAAPWTFYLENIRNPNFMWKIVMKTTDATVSPTLRGVVIAYLPQPEPNWMWHFTVPIADTWELLDGTTQQVGADLGGNTNNLITYLASLFRDQSMVSFTDVDGSVWATDAPGVLVYDIAIVHYDIDNPREGDIRITLLETVETYH